MDHLYGPLIALFLAACILATGCISEDTPAPAPVGGSPPQQGVLIQNYGSVTGQGVVLEGVPRGTIDTITFTVGLAPGVKSVDMEKTAIVYADAVRTEFLNPVAGYRGDPPPGYWGIVQPVNELGTPNLRLDFEEQYVIRINPKSPVVPNQIITVSVKPAESRPLIIRRVAPSAITASDNILPAI